MDPGPARERRRRAGQALLRGAILTKPRPGVTPFPFALQLSGLGSDGMIKTPPLPDWTPTSWMSRPAQQQPVYRDPAALKTAVDAVSRLPPIVVSWEIEALKQQIAEAQRGQRFILQGGDCAESFADCDSGQIARKLKILLQMSLVLLHGLKKPCVRIGRFAGQYAKPRSADTETRDGVTLPIY